MSDTKIKEALEELRRVAPHLIRAVCDAASEGLRGHVSTDEAERILVSLARRGWRPMAKKTAPRECRYRRRNSWSYMYVRA